MFLGELADRLQHRKPGPPRRPVRDQQRLTHQGVQQIQHGVVVGAIESAYRVGALEIEPTGEHRTPREQRLLLVIEVVVGPCHRVAQRVVALQAAPGADQQPEPLIQTVTDLARRHRRHPRGRQLDGQRNPVEASADLHHRGGLLSRGHREARGNAAGAFDKQAHRRGVDARTHRQRGHQPQLLVGDPQSFAAGRQHPHRRRVRQDRLDQIRRSVTHVLAVVEHQQPHPAFQCGGHTVSHALPRLLGDAQHRRGRVGHRRRIGDRGQLEQPDAVRELVGQVRRDFGRQAGLADPAHPGQRHQPMSLQRLLHLGQFCCASDEARRLRAQVSRCRVERL